MISLQTETVDPKIKDLFDVHSDMYTGSELRVLIPNSVYVNPDSDELRMANDFLIVHKLVVLPKCNLITELIKGDVYEDVRLMSTLTTARGIQGFFKLLYGFKLSMSFEELYEIFTVARILQYSKLKEIIKVIEDSAEKVPVEVLTKVLLDHETSFDKKKIMEKIPLKSFRGFAAVSDDPVFLRMLLNESLNRYSNKTKEFQEDNKKLRESGDKLSKLINNPETLLNLMTAGLIDDITKNLLTKR